MKVIILILFLLNGMLSYSQMERDICEVYQIMIDSLKKISFSKEIKDDFHLFQNLRPIDTSIAKNMMSYVSKNKKQQWNPNGVITSIDSLTCSFNNAKLINVDSVDFFSNLEIKSGVPFLRPSQVFFSKNGYAYYFIHSRRLFGRSGYLSCISKKKGNKWRILYLKFEQDF